MPDDDDSADPRAARRPRARSSPGVDQRTGSCATCSSVRGVRGQIIVAVLLAALGFAAVVQVRLTRTDDDFSGQRREELIQLLDSLSAAGDRAQTQIDELEEHPQRAACRVPSAARPRSRRASASSRSCRSSPARCRRSARGSPSPSTTRRAGSTETDLINAIGELREAGAEAIEINDSVRVVASTSFTTDADGVISADGVELRPPYVIDAIGSADTLSRALEFPGGLQEQVEQADGQLQVDESNSVEVSSLHTVGPPEYSQPTDD